jgi:hypothetical protein|tara:strand:- start:264 stop:503 length:240 start_codon:yes stop_codon:yes gene_type:complete
MSRKIKKKNIETELHMRGNAQIEKWAKQQLDTPDPDRSIDINAWAGESPPHTINGIPYEELVAQREQEEDDDEDTTELI